MTTRRRKLLRLGVVAALLAGLASSAAPGVAAPLPPYPGSLADSTKPVDVHGRGDFSGLQIHVNQTADLTTQAVSVTWSWPGHSTAIGSNETGDKAYVTNVLRIMQCWGDPVTSAPAGDAVAAANYVADDPGPAREHCEYGGSLLPSGNVTVGNQYNRSGYVPPKKGGPSYGQETVYHADPPYYGGADVPFIAANGTVVAHQSAPDDRSVLIYSNEFYDSFSTNESPANYTFGPDGRGGVQFQVQNSTDARGLGCGAVNATTKKYNKCWLAIVPQGETDINGSSLETRSRGVYTPAAFGSPLASTNWANRIVVPLDFLPSASACGATGDTYGTLGSPLVANALLSWQSQLCGSSGTVFSYAQGTDQRSRDALATGTQSMQFVSDPVPSADATTPITYAPVTLSGLGLAFIWDKATINNKTGATTVGQPLPAINLDQRLVAKLLTYSYLGSNPYRAANAAESKPPATEYTWLTRNPLWLGEDPEFLALNPDVVPTGKGNVLQAAPIPLAFVQGPLDGSDGIRRLWQWVMSDKDARNFMAGVPDPYGMTVDPYYSTNKDVNPTGFAFDTNIDGLPYADPWQGLPGFGQRACDEQPTLSTGDVRPAAKDLSTVAKDVLTVNPLEKYTGGYVCNAQSSTDIPPGWRTARPGVVVSGTRQLMGLTDTASGSQFGVTFANLRNASGAYVGPSTASVTAAATHLAADNGVQGVEQPDLATTDRAAYPLSLIGYAGVTTNGTPRASCAAYAQLLSYAAGAGQTAGTSIGDLPPGYVPLPATLRQQAATAARTVAACAQTSSTDEDTSPTTETGTDDTTPPADDMPADTSAPADTSPVDSGDTSVTNPSSNPSAPVSLAAASRTKPDPSVFAYVVPIALGIGLLSLLTAPLSGLRRRRPGGPPGAGS